MRKIEEILKDKRIKKVFRRVENDKAIQLKVELRSILASDTVLAKFTRALGWEHLCISHKNKIPSWNTMQEMKELFFEPEEVCFQLHPANSEYINNHEYCLHIWRPLEEKIPLPPTILVGFRKGHEEEDREKLKQLQEELGNPLTDREIDVLTNPSLLDNMNNAELMQMAMRFL